MGEQDSFDKCHCECDTHFPTVHLLINPCVCKSNKASDIDGGFILIYGGIEENCSLAAMFHAQKEEMADKLNSLLFT